MWLRGGLGAQDEPTLFPLMFACLDSEGQVLRATGGSLTHGTIATEGPRPYEVARLAVASIVRTIIRLAAKLLVSWFLHWRVRYRRPLGNRARHTMGWRPAPVQSEDVERDFPSPATGGVRLGFESLNSSRRQNSPVVTDGQAMGGSLIGMCVMKRPNRTRADTNRPTFKWNEGISSTPVFGGKFPSD